MANPHRRWKSALAQTLALALIMGACSLTDSNLSLGDGASGNEEPLVEATGGALLAALVPTRETVPGTNPAKPLIIDADEGRLVAPTFAPASSPNVPSGAAPSDASTTSLWWSWSAEREGPVTFSTHGSEIDTVLTVYEQSDDGRRVVVATNDDDGDVTTSSVTFAAEAGVTYAVEARSKYGDVGLVELSWHSPQADQEPSGAISFSAIPVSTNTGEKPQSKVWEHDGTWWAVLASRSVSPEGAWLWRLGEDDRWTNVLHLSDDADGRADAKVIGDVVHIVFHGPAPHLVSIEYDDLAAGYQMWSARPTATPVSLLGSETATIDIDSTGRLWLAVDAPPEVHVYYSDAPYDAFAGPVVLAEGIANDDITAVTALPGGLVGVLWSNQNSQRFGFRTHVDGDPPELWSTDEVPANGSALPLGGGMADDHMNLAVSSDGTLYAAVKTSYNSADHPVIALLVRRPDGVWDPLHEVDRLGTRPIVLLNEDEATISVVYTEAEVPADISWKTSSTDTIAFDQRQDLMDGAYNNPTSTRQPWQDRVLVLASSASHAHHAFLEGAPDPSQPVAQPSELSVVAGASVESVLEFSGGGDGEVVFELVTGPTMGEVSITDTTTGTITYNAPEGLVGSDSFTFRVSVGGVWSEPATVAVLILPESGLRGWWELNGGGGPVQTDGSGLGNDAVVVGAPTVIDRGGDPALELDGVNDYLLVPDGAALELSGPMTVALWVKPDQATTQYILKKAGSGVDGFEVGLSGAASSTSQKVFGRFNESTSQNQYRVNSTSTYPIDGTWIHVAVSYDGSVMRIFINGVEEATVSGPTEIGTNDLDLAIGAQPDGAGKFAGGLDDVRLYGRALSETEVAVLAGLNEPGGPLNPVASELSVEAGGSVEGAFMVAGGSGDEELVFEVVDSPGLGTLIDIDPVAGSFTYVAPPGRVGLDSFTFRVSVDGMWSEPTVVWVVVFGVGAPWLGGIGS